MTAAGLEEYAAGAADQARPRQRGAFWRTSALSRSTGPESWPEARMLRPSRLWPV